MRIFLSPNGPSRDGASGRGTWQIGSSSSGSGTFAPGAAARCWRWVLLARGTADGGERDRRRDPGGASGSQRPRLEWTLTPEDLAEVDRSRTGEASAAA